MNISNEKEQLITQLLRESIAGRLSWVVKAPPQSFTTATEKYVPLYIETIYKNSKIGVYELREKYFLDEERFYWSENIGICIVQDPEMVVWQAEEYSPALKELFQMARHYASGIRNILGS